MVIEHLDACGQALITNGLPCSEYQMWLDDANLVHYCYNFDRPLTDEEDAAVDRIMSAYFRDT